MSVPAAIEIPDRPLFKASEVCELLKLQPYVLKTWEAEFPELGVTRTSGAARVYRRGDVEQVLRIKHLLLVEGLTLAGVRRKLEGEAPQVAADEPMLDDLFGQQARERLTELKRGLKSILAMLNGAPAGSEFSLAPPEEPVRAKAAPKSASAPVRKRAART